MLACKTAATASPVPLTERIIAALLLVGALPVIAATVVTIRVLSGGAPLIAHRRVGWRCRPFWMFKVRTMWDRRATGPCGWIDYLAERPVPAKTAGPDPRVTSRFAAFCRKFSIDELPQLAHVAAGTMSLVGPRPLTAAELEEHYAGDAAEVLSVPPGLSGLWQVRGRSRLTYAKRHRLDLFFVRRRSWRLYLGVLLRTPLRVLSGRDAS